MAVLCPWNGNGQICPEAESGTGKYIKLTHVTKTFVTPVTISPNSLLISKLVLCRRSFIRVRKKLLAMTVVDDRKEVNSDMPVPVFFFRGCADHPHIYCAEKTYL